MCGIFGIVSTKKIEHENIERCLNKIKNRGPDGRGIESISFDHWHLDFAHVRLSILDIEGGRQPFQLPNSKSMITFNGEIYNYQDLKSKYFYSTVSRSDTEVVLHQGLKHGIENFNELDGFFAFAIWNNENQVLTLARDRFGIKPLYYQILEDGGIAFASELKPLLELGFSRNEISKRGLADYLFFDGNPKQTIIKGIKQLEPGQFIRWKNGKIEFGYFINNELNNQNSISFQNDNEASEILWQNLRQAVRRSFISDVPVGLLLSGGIDSTAVALAAYEEFGKGLPSFTIGFEDKSFDESSFAKLVSSAIGSEFFAQKLSLSELVLDLDGILSNLDAPLADPSFLPTYRLCQLAKQKVKVCVGGDGADEIFWGYPTYWAHAKANNIQKIPLAVSVGKQLASHVNIEEGYQSLGWKLKRFFGRWDDDQILRHMRWMSGTDLVQIQSLIDLQVYSDFEQSLAYNLERFYKDAFPYPKLDMNFYLPTSVLAKVDRASMSVGLEVRPPFLSNEFANWSQQLSPKYKIRGRTGKWLLRKAIQNKVPQSIVQRPKHGFALPMYEWFRRDLQKPVLDLFKQSPIWDLKLLDRNILESYWHQFIAGKVDMQKTFWAILVLDRWLKSNSQISRAAD